MRLAFLSFNLITLLFHFDFQLVLQLEKQKTNFLNDNGELHIDHKLSDTSESESDIEDNSNSRNTAKKLKTTGSYS